MALALLLLVGASIAFASQALDDAARNADDRRPNSPPPPAPTLLTPPEAITREQNVDLAGTLPTGLRADQRYRLRVYVNGDLVRERDLPAEFDFTLKDVPLERGTNEIRAAIVGDGGEGSRSAPISVLRDDVAPVIRIARPDPGSAVYGEFESLRGRTEPGASVRITDEATDELLPTVVQPDGRFETTLSLAMGENRFSLRSEDQAGNAARTRLVVVRRQSRADITLNVNPTELTLADLPARLAVGVVLTDELGEPAEGAEVSFSVSPPNRATMTYVTTSEGGRASWPDLLLADDGRASGTWLVTVHAVLPSGIELREDESISVQ